MRLEDAEPFIRSRHPGVNVSLEGQLICPQRAAHALAGTASESLPGKFDCGFCTALRPVGCRRHATLAGRTDSMNFEVRPV